MNKNTLSHAIDRRNFLKNSLGAAAALGLAGQLRDQAARAATSAGSPAGNIVDVNVNLERWPFRKLYRDEVPHLLEKLRSLGIIEAWAGSFDGLLHKDIASVNARLAESCRRHGQGMLVPFGSVNPTWPEWEEDVRRCHEVFKMPGIRLHPSYHGYDLKEPRFKRLLQMAAERGLVVQLVAVMEDERTQHPLVNAPAINTAPLAELVPAIPKLKLVILNSGRGIRGLSTRWLTETSRVYHDISWLEGSECIGDLFKDNPAAANQTLFGSHAPLFQVESAVLKVRESELTPAQIQGISSVNARKLLPKV
ncbi:MAG: amidohydrolase family protein [Verrucomicrobia bacterium]|nr:amidohydrolase family protein [Verrucomicrobiota bacterium]